MGCCSHVLSFDLHRIYWRHITYANGTSRAKHIYALCIVLWRGGITFFPLSNRTLSRIPSIKINVNSTVLNVYHLFFLGAVTKPSKRDVLNFVHLGLFFRCRLRRDDKSKSFNFAAASTYANEAMKKNNRTELYETITFKFTFTFSNLGTHTHTNTRCTIHFAQSERARKFLYDLLKLLLLQTATIKKMRTNKVANKTVRR